MLWNGYRPKILETLKCRNLNLIMTVNSFEESAASYCGRPCPYSLDLFEDDGYGNRVVKSMPTPIELHEFYGQHFERQSYQRLVKKMEAFRRACFCLGLLPKRTQRIPSILEIGSGNGQFLAACRSLLKNASLSAVEFANSDLLNISSKKQIECFDSLDVVEEQSKSYDLISLWHVIEHMIDPWNQLVRLFSLLKPQGIMVFSTPNMFCHGARRFPESWPWNQSPPVHLWHFGPETLQKRLKALFPEVMIKVFTRESRDANFLFDALMRQQFFDHLPGSAGNNLRFQAVVRLCVACINEALVNPVLRRKGFGGAEIIAMVRNG